MRQHAQGVDDQFDGECKGYIQQSLRAFRAKVLPIIRAVTLPPQVIYIEPVIDQQFRDIGAMFRRYSRLDLRHRRHLPLGVDLVGDQ